jgi:hypothetical protein
MYDDLLGPRPKKEKSSKTPRINLVDESAKPANPDKYPSHESARNSTKDADGHGSVSSSSTPPTPKDPWKDVQNHGPFDDDGKDDCNGDCDNCENEDCKMIEEFLEDFYDDDDLYEDAEDTWIK